MPASHGNFPHGLKAGSFIRGILCRFHMDENWVQSKTKLYSAPLSHDTHEGFTTGPTLRYHRHTDITVGEANESAGRLGQMLDPPPQGQKNATHFQPVDMLGFLPTQWKTCFQHHQLAHAD